MAETKLLLETESYRLYETGLEDWPYWLQSKDGEGMGMSKHDLEDMLDA